MEISIFNLLLTLLLTASATRGQYKEAADELKRIDNIYQNATRRAARFFPLPSHFVNHQYQFQQQHHYEQPSCSLEETYDFVIVGSGSSGSVLANRLSEVGNWSILLLEVGEEATFLTDIPVLAPLFQWTNYNWGYLMEKQDNVCLGLVDQRMAWPRGRALGGSTIINYMINVRGNKNDYKRWEAMGNPGWSYGDVFRHLAKVEDALFAAQDPGYHGRGGYLTINDVPHRTDSARLFIEASKEAGYREVDYNGKSQLGVSWVQATQRRGWRCSAEKAYLWPARDRPNLKILTKSRAVEILIDPETKQATGIKFVKDRKYHVAKVRKEVILSAGAFNSPQLLMLSGIGPKRHLEELGIPLVYDLPVGQKLYDHLTFPGLTFIFNESLVDPRVVNRQEDLYDLNSFFKLIANGTGPLTTLGGVEALAYMDTDTSDRTKGYPNIELIFIGGGLHTDKGEFYRKTFRISDDIYNRVWRPLEGMAAFQVLPMLLHPKSYGYLKLKSKNPYHWPRFYGNFFTDPLNQDIKTFIASIREVQRIMKTPIMKKYGVRLVKTPIPGCEGKKFNSDRYWECALRHISVTLHHQVSTCKMGPSNDSEAIVDNKLRVYGVKGLRVADTSIIPLPLAAHTSTPAYMIGEKASDLIKDDWLGTEGQVLKATDIRATFEK